MDQSVRVFIVDDEYQSRLVIVKMLSRYFSDIQVVGQASTVEEAIEGILALQPNIVFLDVQLHSATGFDVLDKLSEVDPEIIFTTAYPEYAVKAFRYSAIDYLVKPIDPSELEAATGKAISRVRDQQPVLAGQIQAPDRETNNSLKYIDKIAVPTTDGLLFISTQNIVYCQGQINYTLLYLTNGQKITSSHTLKTYETMLGSQHFFRAHKSYLINLQHVEMYQRGEGGSAIMSNGHHIEIARRSKAGFLNLFKG
jgi:two-component system LytT family response regulator